jgi:PAS domain S-box-containing protein/putative nucleotidyltransferase with HDIG domain
MKESMNSDLATMLQLGWKYAWDAMLVCDCQTGVVLEANPAAEKLTGYSRQELIGKPHFKMYPVAEHARIQNAFLQAINQQGIFEGYHLQRKDGQTIPVSVMASEAFEVDGRQMIIAIFRDVSILEDREKHLVIMRGALDAYANAALALACTDSSANLMQDICTAITQQSVFRLAWVGFPEEGPEKLFRVAGAAGPAIHYLDKLKVSWSEDRPEGLGPSGIAYRTNTVQVLENIETSNYFKPWRELARREGICSSITIPFHVEDDFRGALMVYASSLNAFGPVVTEAFTHLAQEIGIGLHARYRKERLDAERLQREQAQQELATAMSAIVGAITTATEMRDPYTAGHQHRVAELAYAISKEMGWAKDRMQALRVAAQIHDIGKISIPTEILTKPTRLSAPEWSLIREHSETGYSILKDVPFKWKIAEAVRQHHERMNGSGYPQGLKGDAILPGARILAVADIVEAMASTRPYRPALGIDAALREIERQAGTSLDAEIVRICVCLFRKKGFVFPVVNLR